MIPLSFNLAIDRISSKPIIYAPTSQNNAVLSDRDVHLWDRGLTDIVDRRAIPIVQYAVQVIPPSGATIDMGAVFI